MRDYCQVSPKFWIGETGQKLRSDRIAREVMLYLISSPFSNMIGVYYCPLPTIVYDLYGDQLIPIYQEEGPLKPLTSPLEAPSEPLRRGIRGVSVPLGSPSEEVKRALLRLEKLNFCLYDFKNGYVFVKNLSRWQIAEKLSPNDNRIKNIKKTLEEPPKAFKYLYLQEYNEPYCLGFSKEEIAEGLRMYPFVNNLPISPFEAPSEPLRSQEQEQEREQEKEQEQEEVQEKEQNSENAKVSNPVVHSASEASQHSDCAKDPTSSNGATFPKVEGLFNVKSSPYTKESALDSENASASEPAEEKNSAGSTVVNDLNVQSCSNENLSLYTEAPSLNNSDNANGTTLQPMENSAIQQTPSCVRETNNSQNNSDNHGASPTTSQTTTVTCTTEDKEQVSESNEPPSCVKGDSSQNNHETLETGTTPEQPSQCGDLFGYEEEPSNSVQDGTSACNSDGSYELPHPKTGEMIKIEANFVRAEKPEEISEELWKGWIAQRRKKRSSARITQNVIDAFREACEEEDCTLEEGIELAIHRNWQGLEAEFMVWNPPMRKRFCTDWGVWDGLCKKFKTRQNAITKIWLEGVEKKAKLYNITTEEALKWIIDNNARDFVTDWYEDQHPEYKGVGNGSRKPPKFVSPQEYQGGIDPEYKEFEKNFIKNIRPKFPDMVKNPTNAPEYFVKHPEIDEFMALSTEELLEMASKYQTGACQ